MSESGAGRARGRDRSCWCPGPGGKCPSAKASTRDPRVAASPLPSRRLANPIVTVRDGQELDRLCRTGRYAGEDHADLPVAVPHLKMPKVDGLEVLPAIRDDARLALLPVVILTSPREESDLVRSCELGVNACVVKPVDFDVFAEAASRLGTFWAAVNEPPPMR